MSKQDKMSCLNIKIEIFNFVNIKSTPKMIKTSCLIDIFSDQIMLEI